jgi:hypothetical protein
MHASGVILPSRRSRASASVVADEHDRIRIEATSSDAVLKPLVIARAGDRDFGDPDVSRTVLARRLARAAVRRPG